MTDLKKERDKFAPWEDEEGRKRKPSRGDSIPPKTNIQSRVHSKPKTEGQDYLDMYIRSREKERVEKYGEILGKQLKEVSDSWRDIKKDLLRRERQMPKVTKGGIEESEEETNRDTEQKKKTPGHMKKMDWSY
ncbi:MAG: hypothetical protein QMC83_01920 [Thermodesulfovibrionales bacterium]|nr:hypothetical protein [Thermodesulfovibrionales bacterium]